MAANPIAPKIVGIIGSAIAGPTLGLQLLSHPILASRFKPIIFDKSAALPSSSSDKGHGPILPSAGAAVALFSNGLFPLYNLNLRASLDVASSEMSCLTIWRSDYGSRSPDGSLEPGKCHQLNSCTNPTWNQELQTGARAIERQTLQRLLVSEYLQRGGEVQWGKNAVSFSRQDSGQIRVLFSDGTDAVVDLLVGADGGFSTVRKFILNERNPSTAEARWLPDFMGMSGFYGISTPTQALAETRADPQTKESTHAIWLDNGNLSVAPLPDGKVRWDLMISEKTPPDSTGPVEPSSAETSDSSEPWETAIMPGMYPRSSSVEVLRKHAEIYHPVVGTFGKLLESAERIIRSPLRQRVWTEEEIQYENIALIGDAARLMLPSSGQGTGFAIEDATVLANTLLNRTSAGGAGLNIRAALEEYAALRVPRSKKMALVASITGRVGIGEQWYLRALRDWGSRITVGSDMK
jgi:2-polyprenyl-6-methoxyphenol hydroxylase-like FAD-dependent oxidoreductase